MQPYTDLPQMQVGTSGLLGLVPDLVAGYEAGQSIFRAALPGDDLVIFVGPHANRFVLTSARAAFSHHRGWSLVFGDPPNLLTMDGAVHDDRRRATAPAFAAAAIERSVPLLDATVRARIGTWADRGEVDVYEETRDLTFDVAAQAFLGVTPGAELDLVRAAWLDGTGMDPLADVEAEALIRRKLGERRDRPVDDALGLLARHVTPEGRRLDDAELLAHAKLFLLAGYETSATLGAWALYRLAAHPEYEPRVADDVARNPLGQRATHGHLRALAEIDRLLLEVERLHPPVPFGPRGTVQDVTFEGYRIPPGTSICYAIIAAHQLPGTWRRPERFDPDRFAPPREGHHRDPYSLAGFGGGARRCIGMAFARAELTTLIARVVESYRLELVSTAPVVQSRGLTAHPLGGMKLAALPRRLTA